MPSINPPIGFYYGNKQTPYVGPVKTATQITYVPKMFRPLANGGDNNNAGTFATSTYSGTWYPKARPMKHWRLRGAAVHLGTDTSLNQCVDCSFADLRVGTPFKMLGKKPDGTSKYVNNKLRDASNCLVCDPTRGPMGQNKHLARGNVFSFNGTSTIRSAVTLLKKNYYSDTRGYLQSRSKTYDYKLYNHDARFVEYFDADGNYIWPTNNPETSSSRYYGQGCAATGVHAPTQCPVTIYKPNNWQYAQQGGVSSSARITRLKYNTITKNSSSFRQTPAIVWGSGNYTSIQNPNLQYTGNPTAPYFIKSKVTTAKAFHRSGNKTICGSCTAPAKSKYPLSMAFSMGGR